ncbi:protein kinase domain-containing protein [Embleya sp. AB8]|uniref:serine/threonine-protein kinase n=1 Tax=Embleya sp. AB8 TaxID=3156304 RepID=UPI003C750B6A
MEPLGRGDPQRVGRFRLIGVLGSGGTGRVFLGRAPDGAAVAVKVMHPHLLTMTDGRAEFRRRFAREVESAREVDSAFIVSVVDADAHAEVPWLATEFVPGIALGEAVRRFGPLPEASLLVLAAGLFAALARIHAVGLVHRDIKPSNIVLGVDGPKVVDFGIALPAGTTALTRTGQTVGTMGFMSPEQFERPDVGPESDVFSAGAVLVHAATGRPPFPGDTLPVLFASPTTRTPDLDGLPAALVPLVEAALAKHPTTRPTAEAARAMLPAPPTDAGDDAGWLPPAVTHAILRATITVLSAPGPVAPYDNDAATGTPLPQARSGHATSPPTQVPQVPQETATAPDPAPTEPETDGVAPKEVPPPRAGSRTSADGTFDISWTGREPITDYARPKFDLPTYFQLWTLILLAVATACIHGLISRWSAMDDNDRGGKDFDGVGRLLLIGAGFTGFIGLVCLGGLVFTVIRKLFASRRHRLAVPHRAPWSLRIGPRGITTTDDFRRTIPWDQVEMVGIEPIRAPGPAELYVYPGLRVQFVDDANVVPLRTAGWFYPGEAPTAPSDREAGGPVCVLGPLIEGRHFELTEALARHAGPRWNPKLGLQGANPQ